MDNTLVSTKDQAIEWIHALKTLGIKPGLTRMQWLMDKLGHPERNLKFVHVAGTNGKGSTVSFVSQVLKNSGYRVGTFTSPYLIDFTNRIQVNGDDIDGDHLVEILNMIIPLCDELEATEWGAPTEFEVITTIAILYFAKIAYPDVIVWETGLGGRLDSTNIVTPLISVITNIGYDHMNLLGYDIKEIAMEKAGIIKQGIPVVSGVENIDALEVIKNISKMKKSSMYQMNEHFFTETHSLKPNGSNFNFKGPYLTMPNIEIKLVGPHQIKNAAVALMALEILRQYYAFFIDEDAIYLGMKQTFWPGRFEVISSNPTIIIDGAHNPEGARSLKETVSLYNYKKLFMVTGILSDKAIADFFKEILPISDELIITEPDFHRAAKLADVSKVINIIDPNKNVVGVKDWRQAINEILKIADSDDLIVITGSLYLISDVRRYFLNELKETIKFV